MAKPSIDRIDRPDPALLRSYQARREPVLIRGMFSDWAAWRWTPDSLAERFGGLELSYETWDGPEDCDDPVEFFRHRQSSHKTTLKEFVAMMEQVQSATRGLYCAGLPIFDVLPQLRSEIGSRDPFLGLPAWFPAAVRQRTQVSPYLWMGPAGALSTLHFDRMDNFFCMIHGRKKWTLVRPEDSQRVYFPSRQMTSSVLHFSPVDVEHPDLARFPRFADVKCIEVTVEEGEVLYTPAGWWHHVRGLSPSIALNFFWSRPLENLVSLRHYLYALARRRVLTSLGQQHLASKLELG